jgi:hypothetical protein
LREGIWALRALIFSLATQLRGGRKESGMKIALATLLVALTVTASAQTLTGKWAEVNGKDQIEFTAKGTFVGSVVYGSDKVYREISGTYFVDGSNVVIDLTKDEPMTWNYKINSAGELIVTYVQGGWAKVDKSMAKFQRGTVTSASAKK